MKPRNTAGMTLVEVTVALTIGSIMMVIVFSLFPRVAAFHRVDEQVRGLEAARQGVFLMAEEIRTARNVEGIGISSMTFSIYDYQPSRPLTPESSTATVTVRYRYDAESRTILREVWDPQQGGFVNPRIIVRHVVRPSPETRLFSSLQDSRMVRLRITVQDWATPQVRESARTFRTEVFLRNSSSRT